jgi:hypothetical protein
VQPGMTPNTSLSWANAGFQTRPSGALEEFLKKKPAGRLFDLHETGEITGWTIHESR